MVFAGLKQIALDYEKEVQAYIKLNEQSKRCSRSNTHLELTSLMAAIIMGVKPTVLNLSGSA